MAWRGGGSAPPARLHDIVGPRRLKGELVRLNHVEGREEVFKLRLKATPTQPLKQASLEGDVQLQHLELSRIKLVRMTVGDEGLLALQVLLNGPADH